MSTEDSDNCSGRPLRLLVLAEREACGAPGWPAAWGAAQCVFVGDLYAVLTELVRGPWDGLVIDARRLTTQWARAIGLIREHVGVAVWLLESAQGRPAMVAQAMEQGARNAGEASVSCAGVEDLATALLRLHSGPRGQGKAVNREAAPEAGDPEAEPVRLEARGGRSLRDFTESAQNPVESEPAVHYHGEALQPVLTEEELRALLGPEP